MDYRTQALDASDRILEAIGGALGESVPNAADLVLSIVTRDTLNLCFNWEGDFYRALTRNGAVDFSVVSAEIGSGGSNKLPTLATLEDLLLAPVGELNYVRALVGAATGDGAVDAAYLAALPLDDIRLLADFFGSIIGVTGFLRTDYDDLDDPKLNLNRLRAGDDLQHGADERDRLEGGGGSDTLMGYGGDDGLDGRWGDDVAFGGAGNDRFNGFEGNDVAHGDEGNDRLDGHKGDDFLIGDAGDDFLQGGLGIDTLRGGSGDDKLVDRDQGVLLGGAGDDLLLGRTLDGGTGNDDLRGTSSSDELIGGKGLDKLTGGAGSDRFIWNRVAESKAGTAGDLVRDFEHGGDILDLSGIDAVRRTTVDDAFSFIGEDKFSDTAGELRIKIKKDGVTVLGDVNGDGRADFIMIVRGEDSLEASDFLL